MTRHDAIYNALDKMRFLDYDAIISIHNNYCNSIGRKEWHIHKMRKLNRLLKNTKPFQIAKILHSREFSPYDKYFVCYNDEYDDDRVYYKWSSFCHPIEVVKVGELSDYIESTGDSLGSAKIRKILDTEYPVYEDCVIRLPENFDPKDYDLSWGGLCRAADEFDEI